MSSNIINPKYCSYRGNGQIYWNSSENTPLVAKLND